MDSAREGHQVAALAADSETEWHNITLTVKSGRLILIIKSLRILLQHLSTSPQIGRKAKLASKNVGCPEGGVKVGFRTVLCPLPGWDGSKIRAEWSRTFPKASQTPWEAPDFLLVVLISFLTVSNTKFDDK